MRCPSRYARVSRNSLQIPAHTIEDPIANRATAQTAVVSFASSATRQGDNGRILAAGRSPLSWSASVIRQGTSTTRRKSPALMRVNPRFTAPTLRGPLALEYHGDDHGALPRRGSRVRHRRRRARVVWRPAGGDVWGTASGCGTCNQETHRRGLDHGAAGRASHRSRPNHGLLESSLSISASWTMWSNSPVVSGP